MSEIKELFEMVTKQNDPDLDSWKEQEQRQRSASRRRRFGGLAVAAAIVAVAAIAFASLRDVDGDEDIPVSTPTGSPTGPTEAVSHYFVDVATGERTKVPVNLGQARLPEVSPDGRRIAYGTCCGDTDALFVAALDGSSDPVQITPEGLNGYNPSWINDEEILFQGRAAGTIQLGDLYTANVSTGEITMITDLPDERNFSWIVVSDVSPDGSTVLYHLPRGKGENVEWDLWTYPTGGSDGAVPQPTLLREDAGFASYGPDGSIVFLDHPFPYAGNDLWIMDGDGRNARRLASGRDAFKFPEVSPDGTMVLVGRESGPPVIFDIATGEGTATEGPIAGDEAAWYGNEQLIG